MSAPQARIDAATAKARQQAADAVKRAGDQADATIKNGNDQIRAVVSGATGVSKKAPSVDSNKADNSSAKQSK